MTTLNNDWLMLSTYLHLEWNIVAVYKGFWSAL